MKKYKYLWAVFYGILLIGFTVYVALDTFVLNYTISVKPQGEEIVFSEDTNLHYSDTEENGDVIDEPIVTENNYQDKNIQISIQNIQYCDTNVYIADVKITSAEYLKTAFAKGNYFQNPLFTIRFVYP